MINVYSITKSFIKNRLINTAYLLIIEITGENTYMKYYKCNTSTPFISIYIFSQYYVKILTTIQTSIWYCLNNANNTELMKQN